MKEKEMNELKQIRERFFADARKYLFANDHIAHTTPCTTPKRGQQHCSDGKKAHAGQSGD